MGQHVPHHDQELACDSHNGFAFPNAGSEAFKADSPDGMMAHRYPSRFHQNSTKIPPALFGDAARAVSFTRVVDTPTQATVPGSQPTMGDLHQERDTFLQSTQTVQVGW